jgi:transposase InsO family protein
MLLPSVISEIAAVYNALPYGGKSAYLRGKAAQLKVSVKSLYRAIFPEGSGNKKRRERPESASREWALAVAKIKKSPPEEAGEITTAQALKIAVENGVIPPEAGRLSRRSYDRIMANLGLNRRDKPIVRFQAEYANLAHHFDASTSKFLYIHRHTRDGEAILRLFRPAKHYKNKPTPVGVRPWVYGAVDDHSGKHICRYTAALGENITDSLAFLVDHAWREFGLPEKLLADQGLLKKGLASQDFLARLGIDFPESDPYAKEAHGKIERPWRTLWQNFELTFFAVDNWEKIEITLTELNARLERYIVDYNARPHRYMKAKTREEVWRESVALRGGKVVLPDNALNAVIKRAERKVATDGTLQYEGRTYTVKGCYSEAVYVFEGLFEGKLTVQCKRTGERFDVSPLRVLPLGEYRAVAETPHQKAVKDRAEISVKKGLFGEDEQKDEQIIPMPLAETEMEVTNPADNSCYGSAKAAMADFKALTARIELSPEITSALYEEIIANGLKKEYVRSLAEELIESVKNTG